jgi:hypothetical protein
MTDTDENLIQQLVAKLRETVDENDRLKAENERLSSALGAHGTLKAIYSDSSQPATVRVRAAQAAIGHESAPLKPTEAPLDLVAEPIEPLAVVMERQRARMNKLLALSLEERAAMIPGASGNSGNGDGDQ